MKKPIYLAILLLIAAQLGSADLLFQPQFSTVNVGGSLTVDVMYSGAGSPWLGGYDIDIGYNPAILDLAAVAWPDDFLGTSLRDATFAPPLAAGTVNVAEVSMVGVAALASAQSGQNPFRLFELLFIPLAPGVSSLTFTRVELSDAYGDPLAAGNTPAGSVTVLGKTPVPEPGLGVFVLLPALAGLTLLRKRRSV